jgi:hypothetical protein
LIAGYVINYFRRIITGAGLSFGKVGIKLAVNEECNRERIVRSGMEAGLTILIQRWSGGENGFSIEEE